MKHGAALAAIVLCAMLGIMAAPPLPSVRAAADPAAFTALEAAIDSAQPVFTQLDGKNGIFFGHQLAFARKRIVTASGDAVVKKAKGDLRKAARAFTAISARIRSPLGRKIDPGNPATRQELLDSVGALSAQLAALRSSV